MHTCMHVQTTGNIQPEKLVITCSWYEHGRFRPGPITSKRACKEFPQPYSIVCNTG